MATIRENLIAARALIADPAKWTQGVYAQNDRSYEVLPFDPKATCFCALGAASKASGHPPHCGAEVELLYDAAREMGVDGVVTVNDEGTHADVLKMFDLAIEKAPH